MKPPLHYHIPPPSPAVRRTFRLHLGAYWTWTAYIWQDKRAFICDLQVESTKKHTTKRAASSDMQKVLVALGVGKARGIGPLKA